LIYCLNVKITRVPVVLFLTKLFVYQATAEQLLLAQMFYDKNDAEFEDKVKQVMCLYMYTHLDIHFLDHQHIFLESWTC